MNVKNTKVNENPIKEAQKIFNQVIDPQLLSAARQFNRDLFGIHQQKLQELEQLLKYSGIRFRKYTAPVTDLNVLLKKHNVR